MLQNTPKRRLRSIGDNWVCSCEQILWKDDTPKQCIQLRYTRFATFFMQTVAKCSKHSQTSFEVYWRQLDVFVRTHFTEVRYPETVHFASKHPFCMFFHANGSEMLQNNPKHRLRSIGDNWVCSCEHILRKFGTPKQCIRLQCTRFATFFMQIIAKC